MCEIGYQQLSVFDDDGVPHTVCLKQFCGLSGFGTTCVDKLPRTLDNCAKHTSASVDSQQLESCEICMPGYYKYISTFYESSTTGEIILMYNCAEQEGSIEKDFFVRP